MLSCIFLGHIFQRNQAIQPDIDHPYILIGDPYQIPPTGSTPFYETLIRYYVENKTRDPLSPGDTTFLLLSLHTI